MAGVNRAQPSLVQWGQDNLVPERYPGFFLGNYTTSVSPGWRAILRLQRNASLLLLAMHSQPSLLGETVTNSLRLMLVNLSLLSSELLNPSLFISCSWHRRKNPNITVSQTPLGFSNPGSANSQLYNLW